MKRFLILALSVTAFAADEPAGRLLSFRGKWISPRNALRNGAVVYAGEIWRPDPAAPRGKQGNAIEVILYNGKTLRCDDSTKECVIPSALPPKSTWWSRFSARRDAPPSVDFAISRGDTVLDAVLAYAGGQLDLTGALRELEAARYRIILRNLRLSEPPVEFSVDWQPRSPQPVVTPIKPGLYELTAVTPEEARLGPAAVLITSPQAFADRSRELEEARRFLENAQPAVSALGRRQFLLSVLDSAP
jgi:hypothetical protein